MSDRVKAPLFLPPTFAPPDPPTVDEEIDVQVPPLREENIRRYGRGYAKTSAELRDRLERYARIGRLCNPRWGHCTSRAATRRVIVRDVQPDGMPETDTYEVLCCANHSKWWKTDEDIIVVSIEALPPQDRQSTPHFVRYSDRTGRECNNRSRPGVHEPARCDKPAAFELRVIDADPDDRTNPRRGAIDWPTRTCSDDLQAWLDSPEFIVLSCHPITELDY